MRSLLAIAIAAFLVMSSAPATAQFIDDPEPSGENSAENGIRLGEPTTIRLEVGVIVRSTGKPLTGVFATTPVPTDWAEQKVRLVDEDISREVRSIRYRTVGGTTKQMLVTIPKIPAGGSAKVLQTYEISKSSILSPNNPHEYLIPEKLDRDTKLYLSSSPYIETRNQRIRSLAKELWEKSEGLSDWQRVEAIYDWVRENVKYTNGPLKGALAALKDGNGDCEELTSLFVALCRVNDVPARSVWIPGHCYPEFYLVDKNGEGHWFPCQAAGGRAFGSMAETRPILQKGDSFKVAESRERVRYVPDHLSVKDTNGTQPKLEFIRRVISSN